MCPVGTQAFVQLIEMYTALKPCCFVNVDSCFVAAFDILPSKLRTQPYSSPMCV